MSVRVLRIGDSQTAGIAAYGTMAAQLGPDFQWVGSETSGDGSHEGHVGWSIKNISDHLDGWLDTYKPNLVTIIIGTNDAAGDRDPYAMVDDTKRLVHRLGARGISVVLGTIPPYPAKASIQAVYNQELREAIPEFTRTGIDAYLADIEKTLTTDDLAGDKIHMNASGIKKASDVLVASIRTSQSTSRKTFDFIKKIPLWKKVAAGLLAVMGIYLLTTGRRD